MCSVWFRLSMLACLCRASSTMCLLGLLRCLLQVHVLAQLGPALLWLRAVHLLPLVVRMFRRLLALVPIRPAPLPHSVVHPLPLVARSVSRPLALVPLHHLPVRRLMVAWGTVLLPLHHLASNLTAS